jgi:hypothetical protein
MSFKAIYVSIMIIKHDMEVRQAYDELKGVAEADIKGAHGLQVDRPKLSDRAIRLYDDVAKMVEADSDAQAEAAADQG